ncbi:serine/threonine-protein kinase [Calothrix sp. 336/3]|uniref:serine/threonine-protein kinase n=1 Tax=Calothrix sp. 336/3 TaxID=1337936 RepID=UPI0004E43755|nr:serine/threonine-protein kinase [Calothrix sp. 336/3]AKG23206.1 protein kinase [Calothrix sp. 336/3]
MVWNQGHSLFGGRYLIERRLGEGGIGITYLVKNQHGEARVIKTLKEEIINHPNWKRHRDKLRQDFRDEAVRLAVCRHPHIVQIENTFDEGILPCMVMEYIEGEDLGKHLRQKGVLTEAEALLYIQQIGDAVMVIHHKGLLHRDIKPRNIMLRSGKSEAVLIDFGIAREFIPNEVQKHTVYRTPGFAPPEQYEVEAPRGEFIDVYGLAATLYSLVTGVVPTSADDRRRNIPLEAPKNFNPQISDRLNQAILDGMDMESNCRPQSVAAWLDLLNYQQVRVTQISAPVEVTQITPQAQIPPQVKNYNWQCLRTLKAHSSMVHSIAISPDSKIIASGSSDRHIRLWEPQTGKQIKKLGGWFPSHGSMVHCLSFSPNGDMLASASWDETIKLWLMATGKEIFTLKAHTNSVNSVAFSPNGQILASGSNDATIKLWQVVTGREITTLSGHHDIVGSVAFHRSGDILGSCSADNTIKLWQVSTGREINTLVGHSFFVNAIAFSRDGEILASASSDHTIKLWEVRTGKEIRTLIGHNSTVWSVCFSPDSQFLASGSWDKTIKIWNTQTGKEVNTLAEHNNYVRAIAFSANGAMLVSGSDDATVKIWQRG